MSNNLKESQNGDKIKRDLFATTLLAVISLLFGPACLAFTPTIFTLISSQKISFGTYSLSRI